MRAIRPSRRPHQAISASSDNCRPVTPSSRSVSGSIIARETGIAEGRSGWISAFRTHGAVKSVHRNECEAVTPDQLTHALILSFDASNRVLVRHHRNMNVSSADSKSACELPWRPRHVPSRQSWRMSSHERSNRQQVRRVYLRYGHDSHCASA